MTSTRRITPAGDGFYAAGTRRQRERAELLVALRDEYRHGLMDTDERELLRDEILRPEREQGR